MKDLVKHRVWDTVENTMLYDTGVVGDYLVINYSSTHGTLDIHEVVYFDERRYKLMPFVPTTYEEDEVYLADILQVFTPHGIVLGIVIYEYGTYVFSSFGSPTSGFAQMKIPVAQLVEYEVVGNVYENAYLMKGEM